MSIPVPRIFSVLGIALILTAVLLAGCAQPAPTPTPTPTMTTPVPATPATTPPPTTTLPATTMPTTTIPTTLPPTTTLPPVTTTPPAPVAVTIQSFLYRPTPVTVPVGTTVTWTNMDGVQHTVTSDTPGQFGSPLLGMGQTFSFTFAERGTYPYHCIPHPTMHGTVIVT